MTLHETVYLLVLITVINVGMLVARLWSAGIGVAIVLAPFLVVGLCAAGGVWLEWRELRTRLPRARVVRQRAS